MRGERVDVLEAHGRVVGDQRRASPRRPGSGRPAPTPSSKSGPVALCRTRKTSSAGEHGVLEAVLHALAALGEDPPAERRGRSASRKRYSEVVLEPAAITRKRSVRLRPTPTQNRPSGSWWTSSSSAWVGAEPVPPDLVGAPGVVDGRVVDVGAVADQVDAAEDAGDLVGQQLAGGEVLDPHGVALVAGGVGGVGEQVAVGADRRAAEREELVALGQRRSRSSSSCSPGSAGSSGAQSSAGCGGDPVVRAADRDAAAAPYSRPSKERP